MDDQFQKKLKELIHLFEHNIIQYKGKVKAPDYCFRIGGVRKILDTTL